MADRFLITMWDGEGLSVIDEVDNLKELKEYHSKEQFVEIYKVRVAQSRLNDFLKNYCNGQRWERSR